VRDAAFGCDWVGTAIQFQRCVMFIIAATKEGFHLTAGKFVTVSNVTTMNVCIHVCNNDLKQIISHEKHNIYFTCARNYFRVSQ
jgi:hypothetical protein